MEYINSGVNHPKHYSHPSGLEAIDFIERYSMNFAEGCLYKYLFRAGNKDGESDAKDKEKAIWYFKREAIRQYNIGNGLVTWDEAKKKVFEKMQKAFGSPDKNRMTGEINWSKGGSDNPDAIKFIQENCMTLLKD